METPARARIVSPALLGLIVCAAAFTWRINHGLPDEVASHFNAEGAADDVMSRGPYTAIMMAVTVLVPLFIATVTGFALTRPGIRINVPNREYWLAPERRAETVAFLARQSSLFAGLLVLFMCFAQWLAARANSHDPPSFDSRLFFFGLAIFVVCVILGMVRMVRHFRRA